MILKPKDGNPEEMNSLRKQRTGSSSSKMNSMVGLQYFSIWGHFLQVIISSFPLSDKWEVAKVTANVVLKFTKEWQGQVVPNEIFTRCKIQVEICNEVVNSLCLCLLRMF